jgi:hypothetical protein
MTLIGGTAMEIKTWLRLTLIVTTVGGGFCGAAFSAQYLFSPQTTGLAVKVICSAFLALNAYVVTSGLLLVQNSRRLKPVIASLIMQVFSFSSPIVTYSFGTGVFFLVGLSGSGAMIRAFFNFRVGALWEFYLFRSSGWDVGINLFPVALLLCLAMVSESEKIATAPSAGQPSTHDMP